MRVGDRVRCVNPHIAFGMRLGHVYTVTKVSQHTGNIKIEGIEGAWKQNRFELVEDAPPPQAVDNRESTAVYTVFYKTMRDGINSDGFSTERQAEEMAAAYRRVNVEVLAMKKITVRI